jgi:hypothetical protein
MSNAALAKILRVCRLHSRNFLSRSRAGAESTDPLAWTEAAPRQLASRHRIDLARQLWSRGHGTAIGLLRRLASKRLAVLGLGHGGQRVSNGSVLLFFTIMVSVTAMKYRPMPMPSRIAYNALGPTIGLQAPILAVMVTATRAHESDCRCTKIKVGLSS